MPPLGPYPDSTKVNALARASLFVASALCMYCLAARAANVSRDIPYNSPGGNPALNTFDLWTPNSGIQATNPTVIYLHWGGYTGGDKGLDAPISIGLADRGFNVLNANYTLATPGHPSFPQPVRDVKALIRWVRTTGVQLGMSPTIVLAGSSAGGTIAMTAGYSEDNPLFEVLPPPPGGYRVQAIIGLYGRYDLVWDAQTFGSPSTIVDYLGPTINLPGGLEVYQQASAMTYVDNCVPPTKLIHGTIDGQINVQNAIRLDQALGNSGVVHILQLVPGAGHGTGQLANLSWTVDQMAPAIPVLVSHAQDVCDRTAPPAFPANDGCNQAIEILPGQSLEGNLQTATGGYSACGENDLRDVWYRFSTPLTRRYRFEIEPGAQNPGFTLAGVDACDGGVFDCNAQPDPDGIIRLETPLGAGSEILIRVAAATGPADPFILRASAGVSVGPQPDNDGCEGAMLVQDVPVSGTTRGCIAGPQAGCGDRDVDDAWFSFVAPTSARFRFDTRPPIGSSIVGALTDTTLAVLGSCSGATLTCADGGPDGSLFAVAEADLEFGQSVLVRLAGNRASQGAYYLAIAQLPRPDQGACCSVLSCGVTTAEDCGDGTWIIGQACTASPCVTTPGACCVGTTCSLVPDAAFCAAINGSFRGQGSACGLTDNPVTCCPANFNQTGGLSVQDVFDFLGAYFQTWPVADFNHNGDVSVQDVFDFLAAYFAGCF